jgi:hypothetical protein
MIATNYKTQFLEKIEGMILSLGGTVPTMAETTNFEERSLQLLDALDSNLGDSSGSSYIRLNPRVKEWDNLSVSDLGQNYTLSSIPQDGNCLVHTLGSAGRVGSGTLRIYFDSPTAIKPSVDGDSVHPIQENYSATLMGLGFVVVPVHFLVPAVNGQIWARRSGFYFGSDPIYRTDLWVLGYWLL